MAAIMFSLVEYELVFGAIIVVLLSAGLFAVWRRENHESEQKEVLVSLSSDKRVFLASKHAEKVAKAVRDKAEAKKSRREARLRDEPKERPQRGTSKKIGMRERDAGLL